MLCGRSLMVPAWDGRARRRRPPTGEQNGRRLLRLLLHADHARVCAPPPPPRLRTRCIGVCLVQKLTDHFKLTDCCSCAAEPTRSRGTLSPRFSCSAPTYAFADLQAPTYASAILQGWEGQRHGTWPPAVSMLARSSPYSPPGCGRHACNIQIRCTEPPARPAAAAGMGLLMSRLPPRTNRPRPRCHGAAAGRPRRLPRLHRWATGGRAARRDTPRSRPSRPGRPGAETCQVRTEGGTRRVQSVREGGRDVSS